MKNNDQKTEVSQDQGMESRKRDHIDLAFKSQVKPKEIEDRFFYEPLLSPHPKSVSAPKFKLCGRSFDLPIWVSSMTGGTEKASKINKNLASACGSFGMGMGLGSCRILLESNEYLKDFQVREYMPNQALFANLGIAQVEEIADRGNYQLIKDLISKLDADGLIIHINPLQEWLQDEGDIIRYRPLDTIKRVIDKLDIPLIVKEVGQGMGYSSLRELYQLPLTAVEFAAAGGTNFSKLEILRSKSARTSNQAVLATLGHSAYEMNLMTNQLKEELGANMLVNTIIISGGIGDFLDGYYQIEISQLNALYGQASAMLKHAEISYENLAEFIDSQREGLKVANAYLRVK